MVANLHGGVVARRSWSSWSQPGDRNITAGIGHGAVWHRSGAFARFARRSGWEFARFVVSANTTPESWRFRTCHGGAWTAGSAFTWTRPRVTTTPQVRAIRSGGRLLPFHPARSFTWHRCAGALWRICFRGLARLRRDPISGAGSQRQGESGVRPRIRSAGSMPLAHGAPERACSTLTGMESTVKISKLNKAAGHSLLRCAVRRLADDVRT